MSTQNGGLTRKTINKLEILRSSLGYGIKNRNWFKATRMKEKLSVTLTRANMELGKLNYSVPVYASRVNEYNHSVILGEKAKYYWDLAMDTNAKVDWDKTFSYFKRGIAIAEQLLDHLVSGSVMPIILERISFSTQGTEIAFADDIPLVPEILPLIFLQGTDEEMGYQYAQQVIQVYGAWLLKRKTGISHCLSSEEKACLHKWEKQMEQYAPEILGMCRGWAAGATASGVPTSYEDVLDLWCGHQPPARSPYNLSEIGLPRELARPFCSGLAAWGRATRDGRLVTASTGDHNPSHAAVVVAFPKTGNNFIATPFHVTGGIRHTVDMFMMGHPGMNSKGVAYVEHGGEPRLAEPIEEWGYGIRKGTAIFHVLRFANSAKEALEIDLSFPVGDVGTVMGSTGGFWADSTQAFIPECRSNPVAVREAGMLGETDYMYACNGIMHPGLKNVWWMQLDPQNWHWDEHGGWYPIHYQNFDRGMMGNPEAILKVSAAHIQNGNRDRCLFYYEIMEKGLGSIDMEYMKMILRTGGVPPKGEWKKIRSEFEKTGNWGRISAAHSTNTITVVMKPGQNNDGIYSLCHGEAKRGLAPFSPTTAVYMYNETNAFWEIKLAAGPKEVTVIAYRKAEEILEKAEQEFGKLEPGSLEYQPLHEFLVKSRAEMETGKQAVITAKASSENAALYEWSRAARAFTRAQVRAVQVIQALIPPPVGSLPE